MTTKYFELNEEKRRQEIIKLNSSQAFQNDT